MLSKSIPSLGSVLIRRFLRPFPSSSSLTPPTCLSSGHPHSFLDSKEDSSRDVPGVFESLFLSRLRIHSDVNKDLELPRHIREMGAASPAVDAFLNFPAVDEFFHPSGVPDLRFFLNNEVGCAVLQFTQMKECYCCQKEHTSLATSSARELMDFFHERRRKEVGESFPDGWQKADTELLLDEEARETGTVYLPLGTQSPSHEREPCVFCLQQTFLQN